MCVEKTPGIIWTPLPRRFFEIGRDSRKREKCHWLRYSQGAQSRIVGYSDLPKESVYLRQLSNFLRILSAGRRHCDNCISVRHYCPTLVHNGSTTLNPHGKRAWKHRCIWEDHRVWAKDTQSKPVLLKHDSFRFLRVSHFFHFAHAHVQKYAPCAAAINRMISLTKKLGLPKKLLDPQNPPPWSYIEIVKYYILLSIMSNFHGIFVWFVWILSKCNLTNNKNDSEFATSWIISLSKNLTLLKKIIDPPDPPSWLFIEIVKYHTFSTHNEPFYGIYMWFCMICEQVEFEPFNKRENEICNILNCFSSKQSKTCQTILNAQHPPSWLFIKIVKYRMFSTKYESCYSPGISMWFCMIFEQVEFEQQRKWVCNLLNDFSCKQSTTCQNKYWSTTWLPPHHILKLSNIMCSVIIMSDFMVSSCDFVRFLSRWNLTRRENEFATSWIISFAKNLRLCKKILIHRFHQISRYKL